MTRKPIYVGIAELVVTHNPTVLITVGLGSCVAISLRDPVIKIGALAHVVLPSITNSRNKENPLKFADYAIETSIHEMLSLGCKQWRMEAKMAGGACMFNFLSQKNNIGAQNVEAVIRKLEEMKIPIMASDTGGEHGRTVIFNIETGVMVIKSAFLGIKEI
jgi:chemotaxis protein CheD